MKKTETPKELKEEPIKEEVFQPLTIKKAANFWIDYRENGNYEVRFENSNHLQLMCFCNVRDSIAYAIGVQEALPIKKASQKTNLADLRKIRYHLEKMINELAIHVYDHAIKEQVTDKPAIEIVPAMGGLRKV